MDGDQGHPHYAMQEHEAGGLNPEHIEQHAENNGQQESAQSEARW
jgi:hypothetical protein